MDTIQAFPENTGFAADPNSNPFWRAKEMARRHGRFIALAQDSAKLCDRKIDPRKENSSCLQRLAIELGSCGKKFIGKRAIVIEQFARPLPDLIKMRQRDAAQLVGNIRGIYV